MGNYGLPVGYTECEYIESDGTNFIDTGFKPNQNSKMVLDFKNEGSFDLVCIAGVRVANGNDCFMFWIMNNVVYPQFADNNYNAYPISINTGQRLTYIMDKNVATVGDSSVSMASSSFQSEDSIYLFVCNDNGTPDADLAKGKLYSCQIYDNGTLVRDYIPCQNDKGLYGLWDKVNGIFVTNDAAMNKASITWSSRIGSWTSEPVSYAYDGNEFESVSPGDEGSTILRCTFKGLASISFSCSQSSEANYDYLTIGHLDAECTRDSFKESLQGYSNLTVETFTYDTDGEEHFVEFCYSKDSSVASGSDSATVYISDAVAVDIKQNPFTGKWLYGKILKVSPQEFRHRLMSIASNTKDEWLSSYMTIEALEDGLVVYTINSEGISYSIDRGDWIELESYEETEPINKGQIISFKCVPYWTEGDVGQFVISKKCNLKGNCMSLLYGDNANGQVAMASNTFRTLFDGCTTIVSVSEDFLPATILYEGCYEMMFSDCTSLIQAPNLSTTTLTDSCYRYMFYGCTSLVNAPELPATTLTNSCYDNMFNGCTSLVEAPELPALELTNYCYQRMFQGCANLSYIKALFTEFPSTGYTRDWVSGVSSTGIFVKNKDATWNVTGVHGIPTGWTVKME